MNISKCVAKFGNKWTAHSTETVRALHVELDRLVAEASKRFVEYGLSPKNVLNKWINVALIILYGYSCLVFRCVRSHISNQKTRLISLRAQRADKGISIVSFHA